MECSKVRLKLDEYLKNRLDMDTAHDISLHLKNCAGCMDELTLLRELNEMMKDRTHVCADEGFASSVLERIEKEKAKDSRYFFNRFPAVSLGASLVLAGMLTIFIHMPAVSGTISRYTGNVSYGTGIINNGISSTRIQIQLYINNMFNMGGR